MPTRNTLLSISTVCLLACAGRVSGDLAPPASDPNTPDAADAPDAIGKAPLAPTTTTTCTGFTVPTFGTPQATPNYGDMVADLDGDGIPEAHSVQDYNGFAYTTNVITTSKTKTTIRVHHADGLRREIFAFDLNGNGVPDLVIATNSNRPAIAVFPDVKVAATTTTLEFDDAPIHIETSKDDDATGFGYDLRATDVDGDGIADLIATAGNTQGSAIPGKTKVGIAIFTGPLKSGTYAISDATYRITPSLAHDSVRPTLVADVNRDGKIDFIAEENDKLLYYSLPFAKRTVSATEANLVLTDAAGSTLVDLDGDCAIDLARTGSGSSFKVRKSPWDASATKAPWSTVTISEKSDVTLISSAPFASFDAREATSARVVPMLVFSIVTKASSTTYTLDTRPVRVNLDTLAAQTLSPLAKGTFTSYTIGAASGLSDYNGDKQAELRVVGYSGDHTFLSAGTTTLPVK